MRKPTREELIRCLDGKKFYRIETIADAVMALFEDKPKVVKWEEEYFKKYTICQRKYPNDNYHPNDMIFEIVFKPNAINEIPDFIRTTLREMYEDCGSKLDDDEIKQKYGL